MTAAEWSDGAAGPLLSLLAAVAEEVGRPELRWMDFGLCNQVDPDAWFPEKGGSSREAKSVCMACEVRATCLDYAVENEIPHGVWGGLSPRQRRAFRRSTEAAA